MAADDTFLFYLVGPERCSGTSEPVPNRNMFRTCSEHVPNMFRTVPDAPHFSIFFLGLGVRNSESVIKMAHNGVFNFDFGQLLVFGRFSLGECTLFTCIFRRLRANLELIRKMDA